MDTRIKTEQRNRRRKRVRAKIFGTSERPRISVFRSNKYVSAQLIDDSKGVTLASVTSKTIKGKTSAEISTLAGQQLAEQAKAKGVKLAIFDRGGYLYTGSVKALADGARAGGLEF